MLKDNVIFLHCFGKVTVKSKYNNLPIMFLMWRQSKDIF